MFELFVRPAGASGDHCCPTLRRAWLGHALGARLTVLTAQRLSTSPSSTQAVRHQEPGELSLIIECGRESFASSAWYRLVVAEQLESCLANSSCRSGAIWRIPMSEHQEVEFAVRTRPSRRPFSRCEAHRPTDAAEKYVHHFIQQTVIGSFGLTDAKDGDLNVKPLHLRPLHQDPGDSASCPAKSAAYSAATPPTCGSLGV